MHILKHRKLFNSKVSIILLVTLIWLIADNLLEFVFPTYLKDLNKSYTEIGLLLSLVSVAGILIDLPMGSLCDLTSRKRLMMFGLIISIIATILIFSFKGNLLLVFTFLFWGIAYQSWKVPRDAYFASLTEKKNRAEFYGWDMEVKYLGQTLGPLIGGFILLYLSFSGIVSFYIAFLALGVLMVIIYIKETNKRSLVKAVAKTTRLSTFISELKEFKHFGIFGLVLLFFSLLFTTFEQILWTFEPLFYGPDVLNIPASLGGLLLAFFSLPGIFLSCYAGKLADKVGKKKVLFLGLILIGISLIMFSKMSNLYLVFAFALLISLGWVLSLPALDGLIVDLSYKHRKGEISGIWNFFMDVGFVLGPLLGGFIAESFGIRNVFSILGILFLISLVLIFFMKNRTEYVLSGSNSQN